MADVLRRLHLQLRRDHFQRLSYVLRNEFGQDLFAKIIAEDAELKSGAEYSLEKIQDKL